MPPAAWAAGAVVALARVNGLLGAEEALAAQQVVEFDVTLGTLAVTERAPACSTSRATRVACPPSEVGRAEGSQLLRGAQRQAAATTHASPAIAEAIQSVA